MIAVIRHPWTRLYRRAEGSWTEQWEEAQQFTGSAAALEVCLRDELEEYQIWYKHAGHPEKDKLAVEGRRRARRKAG